MAEPILLDTHVAIWLSSGQLDTASSERILDSGLKGNALISPITAWELGLLADKPVSQTGFEMPAGSQAYFEHLLNDFLLSECKFDSAIATAATDLPGDFHKDPADRFLVATARVLGCALMTHDAAILRYAAQGHLRAIAC